jgi:KaiC/GvpD/RAD55 family RecA-like ATPase
MLQRPRLHTGLPRLDELLGGGLLPGTLAVVLGATGIGKTQLGLHFARHGREQEAEPGIIFDMTSRGDSQHHAEYARRMFGWNLRARADAAAQVVAEDVFDARQARSDYSHVFHRSGRRVTLSDLAPDEQRAWQAELVRKLGQATAFFYGNFIHGVRRCVIDGVEPVERASDSFQFQTFDYVYHQILRKDPEWVARDLFRERFRANAEAVARHAYDPDSIGCLLLATSHEVLLDQLLERPLESGDVLSNASTVILMGKVREGGRMTRALHVAKHRGSACDDRIVPFEITDRGLVFP